MSVRIENSKFYVIGKNFSEQLPKLELRSEKFLSLSKYDYVGNFVPKLKPKKSYIIPPPL